MNKGIYKSTDKFNKNTYRVSIYSNNKHLSIGTFDTVEKADMCRTEAEKILNDRNLSVEDFDNFNVISYEKFIVLSNLRDNGIYFRTPIYLKSNYFLYCFSPSITFKFDKDDLFFYSNHKIMKRGNHLFIFDYGMQINLFERYNVPSYSVCGKDYIFKNHDIYDFRYSNIEIINPYFGVSKEEKNKKTVYTARIHINGYTKIGEYDSELYAAIAYNKACDIISAKNKVKYTQNYPNISPKEYADIYSKIKISDKITNIQK